MQPSTALLKAAFSQFWLVFWKRFLNCPQRMSFRLKNGKTMDGRRGNAVTSGIKVRASVFNVWGRPCLCVQASGSMKGGGRGHFRHLLPPPAPLLRPSAYAAARLSTCTHANREISLSALPLKGLSLFFSCVRLARPCIVSHRKVSTWIISARQSGNKRNQRRFPSRGNKNKMLRGEQMSLKIKDHAEF